MASLPELNAGICSWWVVWATAASVVKAGIPCRPDMGPNWAAILAQTAYNSQSRKPGEAVADAESRRRDSVGEVGQRLLSVAVHGEMECAARRHLGHIDDPNGSCKIGVLRRQGSQHVG